MPRILNSPAKFRGLNFSIIVKDLLDLDYDVEWNATLEPWLEETESILAGWTFTISVQQKYDYNR